MDWSAAQYLRFQDERTRPARNLLEGLPNSAPAEIVDLGCGPGNSTELLIDRFPAARITGLDSSPDMLTEARRRLPQVPFELGDIRTWRPDIGYDLIYSNAVLQWLPDHARLFPRLIEHLNPGGTFAAQMPDNANEPSHRAMAETARAGGWSSSLEADDASGPRILTSEGYYAALVGSCSRVDIWLTVYHHPLEGARAIVEWFKGSRLRSYLAPLDEDARRAFLAAYEQRIETYYPRQPDGRVLLAFPRIFIVATR